MGGAFQPGELGADEAAGDEAADEAAAEDDEPENVHSAASLGMLAWGPSSACYEM